MAAPLDDDPRAGWRPAPPWIWAGAVIALIVMLVMAGYERL